jgi:hypothetical protein
MTLQSADSDQLQLMGIGWLTCILIHPPIAIPMLYCLFFTEAVIHQPCRCPSRASLGTWTLHPLVSRHFAHGSLVFCGHFKLSSIFVIWLFLSRWNGSVKYYHVSGFLAPSAPPIIG